MDLTNAFLPVASPSERTPSLTPPATCVLRRLYKALLLAPPQQSKGGSALMTRLTYLLLALATGRHV